MKKIYYLIFLAFFALNGLVAQNSPLNTTGLGQLSYPERLSSIWGYTDSTNREYALVGVYNGVSIVDITNPTNPVELSFVNGGNTIWRELKTFRNYMYVVSEVVNEGLLIADLSNLPSSITHQYKYLTVGSDTVFNAHTLYVDEFGYLYLGGTNLANGAPLIFDLNSDPQNPVYLGTCGNVYAHDMYARNDTVWAANILAGYFSVYDVNNRSNPQLLATQNTSDNFTHNGWLSDNSKYLFTADERAGSYIDAYDVSDLTDIKLLDKWRVKTDEEYNPVPHNVHVQNDYIVVSYYTEGVIILDAKHPDNLVEIAHFDTYPPFGNGFKGCWGVYPYFNSGNIVASDINTGLHIFSANYQRAARLQGLVTDQNTGLPIFDVLIDVVNTGITDNTKLDGTYKTGYHSSGSYQVRFRKNGYVPEYRTVQLVNDSIVVLNVSMRSNSLLNINGEVLETNTSAQGVPNAFVKYQHSADFYEFETNCNSQGDYSIVVPEEEYFLQAGKWGYNSSEQLSYIDINSTPTLYLDTAIYDDFNFDFGWTVSGTIDTGAWERVIPGTAYQWPGMMPRFDLNNDIGKYCYVSGVRQSRSDAGNSVLTSPIFNTSNYNDPHISFYYWFTSFDSTYAVNRDTFQVWISNGVNEVKVDEFFNGLYNWSSQKNYRIQDYIGLTNNMSVSFKFTNSNSRNYQEAAIDKFQVNELSVLTNIENVNNLETNSVTLRAFPIPFGEKLNVEYEILNFNQNKRYNLTIYNLLGQLVESIRLTDNKNQIQLGNQYEKGIYFLQLENQTLRIIKN